MKIKKSGKKLTLNKETVANLEPLGRNDLQEVKGAAQTPCWENLWTMYKCAYMYTGDPETE